MLSYKYLLDIAMILLSTKIFGLISRKFKMPQVVGALLAGIILGPALLDILHETDFIHKLSHLFQENKGDNTVSFEIMELEKTKRLIEVAPIESENDEDVFVDENDDSEIEMDEMPDANTVVKVKVEEIEEIKVVTKLTMPSRRLKVKISNELLVELEKMQVNFKLN